MKAFVRLLIGLPLIALLFASIVGLAVGTVTFLDWLFGHGFFEWVARALMYLFGGGAVVGLLITGYLAGDDLIRWVKTRRPGGAA